MAERRRPRAVLWLVRFRRRLAAELLNSSVPVSESLPESLRLGPHDGNGSHASGLDRRSRGDQTELLQLVELVEVDASLGDLSVLHAEKLDAVANHFLVSRCDGARRAL